MSFAASGHDNELFQYVRIKNGMLTASDNVICMGSPIDSELDICLHGGKFKSALEQCGQNFQFTQVDKAAVSLRSEKFRALIPAIENDVIADYMPDDCIADIDDRVKVALDICNNVVQGKGERTYYLCALLRAHTCVATNGLVAMEVWHGIDLPNGLNIPKRALNAITKVKIPLKAFGFSQNSATFWFEDGSFIRTRLVDQEYPNVDRLYSEFESATFTPLPSDFYTGIDALDKFIVDDAMYVHENYVATHRSLELGASYYIAGVKGGYCFNPKLWQTVRPYVETVCFLEDRKKPTAFYGSSMRGLIMGRNG